MGSSVQNRCAPNLRVFSPLIPNPFEKILPPILELRSPLCSKERESMQLANACAIADLSIAVAPDPLRFHLLPSTKELPLLQRFPTSFPSNIDKALAEYWES